jgi:hypothetical protein
VYIADGRPRTVTFTNNPNGQVLSRIESSAAANNPADYYYFVDGVQVGEVSNNGNHDLSRATYSETFVTRNWNFNNNLTSQPFRWNTTGGVTRGQFGGSGYDPISPESNGMQGTDSRYTVREGDTLQGVAQQLWGDSSLWYMIAEANGLSGAQSPAAGTSLRIPDKVTNIHNSARTFEVYDPNRALGDLSPTAAKPPKKAGKCGVFGQIMMVVIAVAVTALTYGALGGAALTGMSAVLAGAAAGAAGSIASQAFGVAAGIQDKFSWKGVALAALSGAVGGGVGQVFGKGAMLGSQFLGDAVRGAAASALTQGIGVAVGLQKKFDFAGVAAAGIGAGILGAASRHMAGKGLGVAPQDITPDTIRNAAFYANQALSGAAGAIANAATRSLANGSDFGDNILAALPDVIGSTIGNMLADPLVAKIAEKKEWAALMRAAERAPGDFADQGLLPPESTDPDKDWSSRMGRYIFRDRYIDDGLSPRQRLAELRQLLKSKGYGVIVDEYFRINDDGPDVNGFTFADSERLVRSGLNTLFSYGTGRLLLGKLALDGRVMSIRVDNTYDNAGSPATALGDRGFVVNVYRIRQGVPFLTTKGYQAAPLFVVMGHELGHAVLGYRDPDPESVEDVLRNPRGENVDKIENRLRAEAGLPLRIAYDVQMYNAARRIQGLRASGEVK